MSAALLEIGAVARELGIAPSTLRSWERRYNLVVPRRGANGQRLYDSDQLVVLHQIRAQVRRGVRTGAAHLALPGSGSLASVCVRLEPSLEASSLARAAIDELLRGRNDDQRFAFNLRLIASELVKNAVVHGGTDDVIELEADLFPGWAELKVRNAGGRLQLKSLRPHRRNAGRGLEIVDALADAWAIDSGPRGTCFTVRLAT
ncbi:MAG TPA: MerR family transcriptional regulator [Gaiellaceae bacterium]|nr:MerR family transcriptional regulator [Gaiellaceae bacterium]